MSSLNHNPNDDGSSNKNISTSTGVDPTKSKDLGKTIVEQAVSVFGEEHMNNIDEKDYEIGVAQGKMITKIKVYLDNSLIGREALSRVGLDNYHGENKKYCVEKLYSMTLSQVQNVHRVIRDILSRQQEYNFALNECMKQTDTSYTLAKKEIGQIIAEYTNQPYEIGDIENNKKIYEDMLIVPHEDLFTNLSKRLVKYSQDENHFGSSNYAIPNGEKPFLLQGSTLVEDNSKNLSD